MQLIALIPILLFASPSETLTAGMPAPKLEFGKVVKGKAPTLNDGKVHVVEFWATWCGPCRATIPHLTELAKKYKGEVSFTGVSVWERGENTLKLVEDFVKEMGPKMDYTVVADNASGFMAKNWMTAAKQSGIPAAFVVGKDGNIAWIGHPMRLDGVLKEVVDGTFDLKAEQERVRKEAEAAAKNRTELQVLLEPYQEALRDRDSKKALAELDKLVAKRPDLLDRVAMLKFRLLMSTDEKSGVAYAKEMANGPLKKNGIMLINLAWGLIDDSNQYKTHDYKAAAEIAELAAKAEPKHAYTAHSLAAQAKFKDGDKAGAVKSIELAIKLAQEADADAKLIAGFEKKLAEYKG